MAMAMSSTTIAASAENQARWRGFWQRSAEPSAPPPPWESGVASSVLKSVVESGEAPIESFRTAVELGCGSGACTAFLAERGYTATGIDYAEEALEVARARPLPEGCGPVAWVNADCFALISDGVLAAGSVDFIFDQQCFHCLRTVDEGRGEARAVEVPYHTAATAIAIATIDTIASIASTPPPYQVIRCLLRPGGMALVVVGNSQVLGG